MVPPPLSHIEHVAVCSHHERQTGYGVYVPNIAAGSSAIGPTVCIHILLASIRLNTGQDYTALKFTIDIQFNKWLKVYSLQQKSENFSQMCVTDLVVTKTNYNCI